MGGLRVFGVAALCVLATAAGAGWTPVLAGLFLCAAALCGLLLPDRKASAASQGMFSALVVLCLLVAAARGVVGRHSAPSHTDAWPEGETASGWVQGRVRERPEARPGGWRIFLAIERSTLPGGRTGVVCLRIAEGTGVPRFDARLEAFVEVEGPRHDRTPGAFDVRRWLGAHGASAWGRVRGAAWREVAPPGPRPTVYLAAWRDRLAGRIEAHLPGEVGGLLRGLLLGERDAVEPDAMDEFRRAGVLHLLALSGQHVSLIALLLLGLTRGSGLGPVAQAWLVGGGVWVYVLLTGASPSVVRAGLGATVALAGRARCRRVPTLAALAWSATLGPLAAPRLLTDVGFQLSCLASAGLVLAAQWGGAARFADPLWQCPVWQGVPPAGREAARRFERGLRSALRSLAGLWTSTLAAQLAVLPLLAVHFGVVSAVGLLSNLVLVPLSSLLLALGLPLVVVDGLMPAPGALWRALGVGGAAVLQLGAWFARWPMGELACAMGGASAVLAFLALAAAAVLGASARGAALHLRRSGGGPGLRAGAALAACGLWLGLVMASFAPPTPPPRALLEYWVLDVGQGDGQVLEFADGYTLVVDTGDAGEASDAAERVLVPFLRARGHGAVSEVVLTHEDQDHAGGWPTLCRDVRVEAVASGSGTLEVLRTRGVLDGFRGQVRALGRGQVLRRGAGYRIRVLWPPPAGSPSESVPERANDRSVVLAVEVGEEALLLTGDADSTIEAHWRDLPAGARVGLKLGHHGSRSSTGTDLLRRLGPAWAVCSSGRGNRFGHPHRETLERLETQGVTLRRTDREGSLCVLLGAPVRPPQAAVRPTPAP